MKDREQLIIELHDYAAALEYRQYPEELIAGEGLLVLINLLSEAAAQLQTAPKYSPTTPNVPIQVDGDLYYTAQLVDGHDGCSYEINVILKEDAADNPPQVIDHYHGEPDTATTLRYISRHLSTKSN